MADIRQVEVGGAFEERLDQHRLEFHPLPIVGQGGDDEQCGKQHHQACQPEGDDYFNGAQRWIEPGGGYKERWPGTCTNKQQHGGQGRSKARQQKAVYIAGEVFEEQRQSHQDDQAVVASRQGIERNRDRDGCEHQVQ